MNNLTKTKPPHIQISKPSSSSLRYSYTKDKKVNLLGLSDYKQLKDQKKLNYSNFKKFSPSKPYSSNVHVGYLPQKSQSIEKGVIERNNPKFITQTSVCNHNKSLNQIKNTQIDNDYLSQKQSLKDQYSTQCESQNNGKNKPSLVIGKQDQIQSNNFFDQQMNIEEINRLNEIIFDYQKEEDSNLSLHLLPPSHSNTIPCFNCQIQRDFLDEPLEQNKERLNLMQQMRGKQIVQFQESKFQANKETFTKSDYIIFSGEDFLNQLKKQESYSQLMSLQTSKIKLLESKIIQQVQQSQIHFNPKQIINHSVTGNTNQKNSNSVKLVEEIITPIFDSQNLMKRSKKLINSSQVASHTNQNIQPPDLTFILEHPSDKILQLKPVQESLSKILNSSNCIQNPNRILTFSIESQIKEQKNNKFSIFNNTPSREGIKRKSTSVASPYDRFLPLKYKIYQSTERQVNIEQNRDRYFESQFQMNQLSKENTQTIIKKEISQTQYKQKLNQKLQSPSQDQDIQMTEGQNAFYLTPQFGFENQSYLPSRIQDYEKVNKNLYPR